MYDHPDPFTNAVLICGLGRLGAQCAVLLKELGIPVYGLHDRETIDWEAEGTPQMLDRLSFGDCRRHSALQQAGIGSCRAVLFTTSDERVNVSGALASRSLNPAVRLIIRSSQKNLNELLDQSLGNIAALDIAELPAAAFSLAAIGGETVGLFRLQERMMRVIERRITSEHPWHRSRTLHDLNTRWRRVLSKTKEGERAPIDFHGWDPRELVEAGDVLTYIEFSESTVHSEPFPTEEGEIRSFHGIDWAGPLLRLKRLWTESSPAQRLVAIVCTGLVLIHLTGAMMYKLRYPEIGLLDAFNVATVLIFDGYSNMFAQLKLPFPIPGWLLIFSLLMTISGAVVTGMIYAYLTARVLSARLHFRRRTGRIPGANHVVILGLGRLGRCVASMLRDLQHPVACADENELEPDTLPDIPVVTGCLRQAIRKTNCARASSVVVLTEDDVTNLELALLAAQMNENCNLVVRTDDPEFGDSVSTLAPRAHTMSTYALSAEAFAAAALGEKVLGLIRIRHQTVLVSEYKVETGDTLDHKLLGEVTGGYGLVAIMHQRQPNERVTFFPSDDIRLEAGDRLVVLATIEGLRRVEHGAAEERTHLVRVLNVLSQESAFEGARVIARATGCELGTARALMSHLPGILETTLYTHQAERLVFELGSVSVGAEVVRIPSGDAHSVAQNP
jgi:Trk K+ transport system NAD-binding subunit